MPLIAFAPCRRTTRAWRRYLSGRIGAIMPLPTSTLSVTSSRCSDRSNDTMRLIPAPGTGDGA